MLIRDHGAACEIIYVAFGYDYLIMAAHSAATAKKHNPGIICSVVTNVKFDNNLVQPSSPFDHVIVVEKESQFNREIKTNIHQYAHLERCLYLDCDTEIRGSLEPVFRCLDRFDVAMKINYLPTKKNYEIAPGIAGSQFPIWNSGVFFFRKNERTEKLFNNWARIYFAAGKKSDQPALAQAVYQTPEIRLLTLNVIWNAFPSDQRNLKKRFTDVIIWHYRELRLWPEVAPLLYKMHQSFNRSLLCLDTVKHEVDQTVKRYKLFSSQVYRWGIKAPLLRPITIKVFEAIGKKAGINLKREKKRFGESYQ